MDIVSGDYLQAAPVPTEAAGILTRRVCSSLVRAATRQFRW